MACFSLTKLKGLPRGTGCFQRWYWYQQCERYRWTSLLEQHPALGAVWTPLKLKWYFLCNCRHHPEQKWTKENETNPHQPNQTTTPTKLHFKSLILPFSSGKTWFYCLLYQTATHWITKYCKSAIAAKAFKVTHWHRNVAWISQILTSLHLILLEMMSVQTSKEILQLFAFSYLLPCTINHWIRYLLEFQVAAVFPVTRGAWCEVHSLHRVKDAIPVL